MTGFHYSDILVAPLISEKSNLFMMDENKYVFTVSARATKNDIKRAVTERFKVAVESVNIINLPGKPKRVGKHRFTKSVRRKAVVKLAEGEIIHELREAI
jgi:large subunit ribosomal protein L23